MATRHVEPRHWPINDVLDRTDLSALLDELTQPSGRMGPGRKWHCPMPYHDDHRASVSMFRDRHGHERWRCWSGDDHHREEDEERPAYRGLNGLYNRGKWVGAPSHVNVYLLNDDNGSA